MFLIRLLSGWALTPSASTYGPSVDRLYYIVLAVTGFFLVATQGALVFFVWRYHRKRSPVASAFDGHARTEVIWTAIPAVILISLGLFSQTLWSTLRTVPLEGRPPVTIRVQAQQWLWQFQYPGPDGVFDTADDVFVVNKAHIPVGRPVHFELTSRDVIHGFYIPDLRVHSDAVPGLTTRLWVEVRRSGEFELRCSQFCGTNHYQMGGTLTADDPAGFEAWLAKTKADAF
jgi:cytochrome c oxidase subunit II